MTPLNAPMACTICHSSPSRLRVRVAGLRHSREQADLLQAWLSGQLRARKAEARAATGSVVLLYDPGKATPGEILDLLQQGPRLHPSYLCLFASSISLISFTGMDLNTIRKPADST